ncbi:MAG: bifunctional metallophosphatase/5'-nucleotidase, partial [Chthonomonadales bacterium]|nr:bifunctional metallophosphatase/5'-nucleotidase [Chthonomonadales bacterium]
MKTKRELTILQMNDTHGYLNAHQELFRMGDRCLHRVVGGYAKLSGLFKQVRAERGRDAVLALDNGDTLHGTFPAVYSRGEALIEPLKQLALDAWTMHWDIVYGPDRLQELAGQLDHPLLALNGYHAESDRPAFQPSTVIER